jgi:Glycosyltransferase 61
MRLLDSIFWSGEVGLHSLAARRDRKRGISRDLFEVAKRIDIIAPSTLSTGGAPCIMLPDQLDRAQAAAFDTVLADEIAQLRGAERSHPPLRRFEIDDAMIHGSALYASEGRRYFNYEMPDPSHAEPIEELDRVALRSSFVGSFYFGHWLRDDCASHLLAKEEGQVAALQHPVWPDTQFYSRIFDQHYPVLRKARVKKLILYDDITQSPHKAERFRYLRGKLKEQVTGTERNHIVYLKRGSAGEHRRMLNEDEIVAALQKRGVHIVQAEGLPAEQLVKTLHASRLVISVEGSQISHALYTLRDGGGVLAIQPPRRLFNSHMDWTRVLDMHYGIVVGLDQGNQDFTLPVDDLLRTLDLMDERIG